MNLIDGVKTAELKVSSETKELSAFVKDKSKSLVDRLESFEDIINIEVGDTSMTRAKSLEREFDIRQLYVKYEGDNPSGTQKDRIAFAQVYDDNPSGNSTPLQIVSYPQITTEIVHNLGDAPEYCAVPVSNNSIIPLHLT